MAAVSEDVLEELNHLEKNGDNLGKLIIQLKAINAASNKEILDLARILLEVSTLVYRVQISMFSDFVSKIISAVTAAIFSSTAVSAAFLSAACYFLIDTTIITLANQEDATSKSIQEKKVLDDICESLLQQIPENGSTSPEFTTNIIRNMEMRRALIRKDLKSVDIPHFGSMCGSFIGAGLGARLEFDWLGQSIINLACSFVAARCTYSFWNFSQPGSTEEYNRQYIPKPIV